MLFLRPVLDSEQQTGGGLLVSFQGTQRRCWSALEQPLICDVSGAGLGCVGLSRDAIHLPSALMGILPYF